MFQKGDKVQYVLTGCSNNQKYLGDIYHISNIREWNNAIAYNVEELPDGELFIDKELSVPQLISGICTKEHIITNNCYNIRRDAWAYCKRCGSTIYLPKTI